MLRQHEAVCRTKGTIVPLHRQTKLLTISNKSTCDRLAHLHSRPLPDVEAFFERFARFIRDVQFWVTTANVPLQTMRYEVVQLSGDIWLIDSGRKDAILLAMRQSARDVAHHDGFMGTEAATLQNLRLRAMTIPREHGAWGMLLVPLATGAVAAAGSGGHFGVASPVPNRSTRFLLAANSGRSVARDICH